MYRYDDCLSDTCDFVGAFIVGIVPDIDVTYEGLYMVCVVKKIEYFLLMIVWCFNFVFLNTLNVPLKDIETLMNKDSMALN